MGSNLDKLIDAVEAGEATEHQFLTWRPGLSGTRKESAMMFKAYNGSLDAAKALREALLPGCEVALSNYVSPKWVARCGLYSGSNTTPARAWLIAILKAYRAQQVTA